MNQATEETSQEFYQETNRKGVLFIVIVIGLLGAFFLLGFFTRIPRIGPDEIFLGVAGFGFLFVAWRLYRFLTQPRMVFTSSHLTISHFFGKRVFRLDDITGLSSYLETIYPRSSRGRSLPPQIIHRLLVRTRDGRERRVTLPFFGRNVSIIEALESHTGLEVERLPDRDPKRKD